MDNNFRFGACVASVALSFSITDLPNAIFPIFLPGRFPTLSCFKQSANKIRSKPRDGIIAAGCTRFYFAMIFRVFFFVFFLRTRRIQWFVFSGIAPQIVLSLSLSPSLSRPIAESKYSFNPLIAVLNSAVEDRSLVLYETSNFFLIFVYKQRYNSRFRYIAIFFICTWIATK